MAESNEPPEEFLDKCAYINIKREGGSDDAGGNLLRIFSTQEFLTVFSQPQARALVPGDFDRIFPRILTVFPQPQARVLVPGDFDRIFPDLGHKEFSGVVLSESA